MQILTYFDRFRAGAATRDARGVDFRSYLLMERACSTVSGVIGTASTAYDRRHCLTISEICV